MTRNISSNAQKGKPFTVLLPVYKFVPRSSVDKAQSGGVSAAAFQGTEIFKEQTSNFALADIRTDAFSQSEIFSGSECPCFRGVIFSVSEVLCYLPNAKHRNVFVIFSTYVL